jgi:hypothetical protein
MLAPQIGPANSASRAITEPTATPAMIPFSFAPLLTDRTTNIKNKVRKISRAKDCIQGPRGLVAPREVASSRNSNRSSPLASRAPAH